MSRQVDELSRELMSIEPKSIPGFEPRRAN
jgi:hypothetical protein